MSPLRCHSRVSSHDIPQMEGLRSFNVLCKGITWVKKNYTYFSSVFTVHAIKSLLSVNRKIHNCNIGRDKGLFILKDLEECDLGKTVAGKFKKNFQKTSPVDTKAFQTCSHLETERLGPEMIITRILVTSY